MNASERALAAVERTGGFQIHTPSIPKHYAITQGMFEDLIHDPVMAAKVLLKFDLDVFQRCRLKYYWHVPFVMDSSGFSSAKTASLWIVSNLRCLLIPELVAGVYYQMFTSGQLTYWPYYQLAARESSIFRAHLGKIDMMKEEGGKKAAKAELKGPSCYICEFKNGSKVLMPAAGFLQDAKTQAGLRITDLYIDEWTKIEATGSEGIDQQLIGRQTKAGFNQHHPFWSGKQIFLATAEDSSHAAWPRYQTFLKESEACNPDYAVIRYCYKDYSDMVWRDGTTYKQRYRIEKTFRNMKLNRSTAGYLQEGLGFWSSNGQVLYSGEYFDTAYAIGKERNVRPMVNRAEDASGISGQETVRFFLGIDPAKSDTRKADDGAMVVLRAEPKMQNPTSVGDWNLDFVWAYKVRKADADQWGGIIQRKEQCFGFDQVVMDPGGGGNWIKPVLAKSNIKIQDIESVVIPIASVEDEATTMVFAKYILAMFKPSDTRIDHLWGNHGLRHPDVLTDVAHAEFAEAWSRGYFGLPEKFRGRKSAETEDWSDEKRWGNLFVELMVNQLKSIQVQTSPDGTTMRSKNGARVFFSRTRKDFAYAGLFAYTAFLAWLKTNEQEFKVSESDEQGCG